MWCLWLSLPKRFPTPALLALVISIVMHCRYLFRFKCITSQTFQFCLAFTFVAVAAGIFLLNRRHCQAMGLHRRHPHQGIVLFLCWLVLKYLCVTGNSTKTFKKRLCTLFLCPLKCNLLFCFLRPTSSDSLFMAFTPQSTT